MPKTSLPVNRVIGASAVLLVAASGCEPATARHSRITHGRAQAARFLGYEVVVPHADRKRDQRGHRSINAATGLKCRST
jgi:hypothetical protein